MTSLHARSTAGAGAGAGGGVETTATTWAAEEAATTGASAASASKEHRPLHARAAASPTSPRLAPLVNPGAAAAAIGGGASPPRAESSQQLGQRGGHHQQRGGRSQLQPRRPPRLRCAASFGPFRPKALACRAALPITSRSLQDSSAAVDDDSDGDGDDGVGTHNSQRRRRRRRRSTTTAEEKKEGNGGDLGAMYSPSGSVAALSGPSGVAVFHTGSPHRPYLVLDHASPSSRRTSSLAFRPPHERDGVIDGGSVLLAAGGGNGILIWDASGRALSPLLTRLTCCDGAGGGGSGVGSSISAAAPPSPGAVSASQIIPPSSTSSGGNNSSGNSSNMVGSSNNNLAPPAPSLNPSYPASWDEVTCVAWRGLTSSPLLVASSTRQVSLWDLRSSHRRRSRSGLGSAARPCLRYHAAAADGSGDCSPLVHVACDEYSHQVAVMDSAGVVRVYDDRRSSGVSGNGGSVPLGTFWAHSRSGAGVASLRNGASPPCWITWGRDNDSHGGSVAAAAGCVKLWRDSTGASSTTGGGGAGDIDPDSYWYMGETADEGQRNGSRSLSSSASSSSSYDLLAVLGGRGDDGASSYYCARVCPGPFGDVMLTVGPPSSLSAELCGDDGTAAAAEVAAPAASSGWQAELWSVDCDASAGTAPGDGGCCRRIASFRAGGVEDEALTEMIGADNVMGAGSHLLGVELAVGPSPLASAGSGGGACELQVCCLNSNGYLTTHAVPEASSFNRSVECSETQPPSMGVSAAASSAATPGSPSSSPTRIAAQQMQQQQQHHVHIHPIHQQSATQNSRLGGKVFRHHSSVDETSWGTEDGAFARPHATAVLTPRDRASAPVDSSPKSGAARDVIFSQSHPHRVEDPTGTDHQHANKSPLSWSALPPAASPDLRPLDGGAAAAATAADPIAAAVARGLEGGVMQFDLDGPAPTSSGGAAPFSSSSGGAARVEEGAGAKATPDGGMLPSPILSSIQAKAQTGTTAATDDDDPRQRRRTTSTDAAIAVRMPCPRLCGATFGGGGGGGIILFHNGEVSKTWSWFRRNYDTSPQKQQSDHSASTQAIPASSLGIRASDCMVSNAPSKIVVGDGRTMANNNNSQRLRAFRETPRTMLDLMKMNAAAKIAQWGDDADANRDSGDDDDSDSVLDSLSDDEEADDEAESDDNLNEQSSKQYDLDRLYNSHPNRSNFLLSSDGDLNVSSLQKRESVGKSPSISRRYRDERHTDPFAGPSTDPLAPAVIFTNFYSNIVLNGQCHELAEGFKLGDWWLTREGDTPLSCLSDPRYRRGDQLKNEGGIYDENGWGWGYDDPNGDTSQNAGYRTLFPLSARGSRETIHSAVDSAPAALPRNQSVPILPYLAPSRSSRGISATEHAGADDKPLVRNNSMMNNLKRLFNHQKQGTLTPPDQSFSDLSDVRKSNSATDIRHASPGIRRSSSTSALLQNKTMYESYLAHDKGLQAYDESLNDVGVHYNMKVSNSKRSDLISRQIRRTRSICLHNASVCQHVGQPDKGQVWELLAQVVENIMTKIDCHDGWREDGGDALGNDLVSNVLRYYEACGDVQMLATIVCVLSGGEDRRKINEGTNVDDSSPSGRGVQGLLPADDDRYDKYMHTYSSLLYCWGLLNERTELGKHLASSVPGAGGETIYPTFQSARGSRSAGRTKLVVPNHGIAPGIWFAPLCPRCNQPAKAETNICTTCRDYAFRCSICTNAVRGQFTVCFNCGHGGHVDHILAWFDQHTLCPSGCGCSCVFNAVGPTENELTLTEAKAPQFGNVFHQSIAPTDSFFSGYVGSVPFGAYDSQKGVGSGAGRKSRRSHVVDGSVPSATTPYLKSASNRSSKQSYRKRFSRRVSDKV